MLRTLKLKLKILLRGGDIRQSQLFNAAGEILKGGCVVLDEEGRILLVVEPHRRKLGLPKGHTEAGETQLETAVREVREETGYEVVPVRRLEDFVYRSAFTGQRIRVALWLARVDHRVAALPDSWSEWLPLAHLKHKVREELHDYLMRQDLAPAIRQQRP